MHTHTQGFIAGTWNIYAVQKDCDFTMYIALIIINYTNYDMLHEKL